MGPHGSFDFDAVKRTFHYPTREHRTHATFMIASREMAKPLCLVVAGPNGAGKSTAAPFLLREGSSHVQPRAFVNADTIAAGLAGLEPERAALRAGRLMIERLNTLADRKESFAFETTLATRTFGPFFRRLEASGYEVGIVFLWLPSAEHAIARVRVRVLEGGHDIPEEAIRRRYRKGILNFVRHYAPLVDSWEVYDARSSPPKRIASGGANRRPLVVDAASWKALTLVADDGS